MPVAETYSADDRKWMSLALEIAERGAGYVSPNPLVGCVIVDKNGQKIGQGYHEKYGQAHAEVNAVESVTDREKLKSATLYVTLEPCSHHGKTPPCADMIAELPLERVVIAMKDPTPKVNGKGIERLEEADFEVDVGLMRQKATRLNEFFVHYHTHHRPFVTLKIAQTLDGYIAAPDGDSKWISGERSRERVHLWRCRYDAVMIGRNTAELDNPRLTVRHVEGRQPRRIVIDGNLELSKELNLFSDQYEDKTIIITHNAEKLENESDPMLDMLQSDYFRGKTLLVPVRDGHSDLQAAFKKLGEEQVISVLVEAGQNLASALLRQRLVDKVECFISPKILGGGTRSVLGLGIHHMDKVLKFRETEWEKIGKDMLFTGYL